MPADARKHYEALVVTTDEGRDEARQQETLGDVHRVIRERTLPAHTLVRERERLALRVTQGIHSHPAWEAGLGVGAPSTALAKEHVLAWTGEDIKREAFNLFHDDPRIIPNEIGPPRLDGRTCHKRYYGGCVSLPTFDIVRNLVYNMYATFGQWAVTETQLPILVNFESLLGVVRHHDFLMTHSIGKGESQILVRMKQQDKTVIVMRPESNLSFSVSEHHCVFL